MDVIRYFLPPLAAGVLAGVVAVGALLAADVGGLRALIMRDPSGWLALFLLVSGFAVTFGSAALGGAVMALAADDRNE
jgi:hypothetical protein